MAKNKKSASNSSLGSKKLSSASSEKTVKKSETISKKKTEAISEHINKMSIKFENLIEECQAALRNLTENKLESPQI